MNIEILMKEQVVNRDSLLLTMPWVDWWLDFLKSVVTVSRPVVRANFAAAINPTALIKQQRGFGFLRVSYNLRVLTPAGGSGSLQLALAWTDDAGLRQFLGAVVPGNKAGNVDMQSTVIYANRAFPVTGAVMYTTSGTPSLQYSIDIAVENG